MRARGGLVNIAAVAVHALPPMRARGGPVEDAGLKLIGAPPHARARRATDTRDAAGNHRSPPCARAAACLLLLRQAQVASPHAHPPDCPQSDFRMHRQATPPLLPRRTSHILQSTRAPDILVAVGIRVGVLAATHARQTSLAHRAIPLPARPQPTRAPDLLSVSVRLFRRPCVHNPRAHRTSSSSNGGGFSLRPQPTRAPDIHLALTPQPPPFPPCATMVFSSCSANMIYSL